MKNRSTKYKIKRFALYNLFIFFISASYTLFFIPSKITLGSFMGLSQVIHFGLNFNFFSDVVSINIISIVLNLFLLFYSLKAFGKEYFLKSIYGALMLPIYGLILSHSLLILNINIPLFPLWVSFILGTLLIGIGIGSITTMGGSSGGVDILGRIISRFTKLSIGTGITITRITILFLSSLIFNIEHTAYATLSAISVGTIINLIKKYN